MLARGTMVGGFRVERHLGGGSWGCVYEAVQVELGRRVALKLFAVGAGPDVTARLRAGGWPDHRHVVPLYAVGASRHGEFVAMRLMQGDTLARRLARGDLDPALARSIVDELKEVLDAVHAAGLTHGAVHPGNVFVEPDGRAFLSDFAQPQAAASPQRDGAALDALADACGRPAAHRRRRARRPLALVALVMAVAAVVVPALGHDGQPDRPPALAGGMPLGGRLGPGELRSLDCRGTTPSGASPSCTLVQLRLPGSALAAPTDGAIRRWAVRGARGELALQVVRRFGSRFAQVTRSQQERVTDAGLHVFTTDLAVRRGDRIGIELAPGTTVGTRAAHGAATLRWLGSLTYTPAHPSGGGSAPGRELLLQADFVPGARVRTPRQLTGAAAMAAPAARALAATGIELADGTDGRLTLALAGANVALDLEVRGRRVARLQVPDADPRGALLSFGPGSGAQSYPHLEWRNPDGRTIAHDYRAGSRSIVPLA